MREEIRLKVGGVPRRAVLHAPGGDRKDVPLVVLLHGKGGTAEWVLEETRLVEFAAREGFALLAPDALPIDPAAEPRFLTNPQVWNAEPKGELADDVRFLGELIDGISEKGAIDRSRIYVTGFSNGAAMAFRLAAEMGDRLAAIAPVAGHFAVEPERGAARPVPVLWLVGEVDPLMPVTGGTVKSPWGREYYRPDIHSEARRWEAAGGARPQVEVLPGLGHHWPGGLGRLNPKLFGPPNADIPGNAMIWHFFRQHHI